MEGLNQTRVTEFIFVGFTNKLQLQVLLFVLFTLVYVITVVGNVGISALIWTDRRLHTPMYFFLMNLSCVDLSCSSSITPKMLSTIFSTRKIISFSECVAQLFWFSVFGSAECLLLEVMSYDRYVAICNPLLYPVIIKASTCVYLVCASYAASFLNATGLTYLVFTLSFCGPNVIDHFFCDYPPLFKVSCSDISIFKVVIITCTFFGIGSVVFFVISYSFIIATVLKIPSVRGRYKAFSTSASHFIVVLLYFGTAFVIYLQPASNSTAQNKVLSLFYTVVIPMLNPMIYSLRNKDIKTSLEKVYQRMCKKVAFVGKRFL